MLRNPAIPGWNKVLLYIYRGTSKYGESVLRPIFWLLVLAAGSTISFLFAGLQDTRGDIEHHANELFNTSFKVEAKVLLFSTRTLLLLKPKEFAQLSPIGDLTESACSIFGPILVGLTALALRQRLRR